MHKKMHLFLLALMACGMLTANAAEVNVEKSSNVKRLLSGQYDNFVKDLSTLTAIDSGTGNKEGSARIAALLKSWVDELGGSTEFRENDKGVHVIARIKGSGKLRVLVSPHTDTVWGVGEAAKRPFRVDERGFAFGPGAGDCKASVAQTIHMLRAIKQLKLESFGEIVVYFDAEEEKGSPFENAIIDELVRQVDVAIINDTARPNWGIVTQRKGSAKYKLTVSGIGGHSGSGAHAAASATMELVNQLHALNKLSSPMPPGGPLEYSAAALKAKGISDHGQFIPETTLNAGVIGTSNKGGGSIPDNAFAEIQVRSFKQSELERVDREIRRQANNPVIAGTKVAIEGGITSSPVERTPEAAKIIDAYKAIVKREYAADVTEWLGGGGTVANDTFKHVPTLDSVGVEVDPMLNHTEREYADLNTFVPRTVALILLIDQLAGAAR